MKFDVPTFNSVSLMVFACGAVVTFSLSRIFPHVKPLRLWTAGFILMCGSVMSYAAHATLYRGDWLLVAAATLNLQYRILTWSGVRVLFGASARLRTGFAVCVAFCLLDAIALALRLPKVYLAGLVALFFVPFRALTIYEVCKRQRQHLGLGRALVAPGSFILALNAIAPLVLVLLDSGATPMLIGTPPTAGGGLLRCVRGRLASRGRPDRACDAADHHRARYLRQAGQRHPENQEEHARGPTWRG